MNQINPMFNVKAVYIYSDLPSYVRVNKTLPILRDMFREVHYIGVTRKKQLDSSRTEGIHYHIDDRRLGNGMQTIFGILGFIRYIREVLKEVKPEVVIAVNEEYILPFTFGYLPMPKYLVLDLYDSIAMRISGPARLINPLWRWLSELAMRTVHALVEVAEERLAWHRHPPKISKVIYNSPFYIENITVRENLPEKFIYVNGMLLDGMHGVETILTAVEKTPGMSIVFSGWVKGKFLEEKFLTHPKVVNLGLVNPTEIPGIIKASSGVWAHYNPVKINYIYGAPNKLYDAMMVGRPVFLNSENHACSLAQKHGFGIISAYGDVHSLSLIHI